MGRRLPARLEIQPLDAPPDATVAVPGSKSLTNRALVCAALASGTSVLEGLLLADDTHAMLGALGELSVDWLLRPDRPEVSVEGSGGVVRTPVPPAPPATVGARLSGTTARFLLPVLALGAGRAVLDGEPPLRRRPMGVLVEALRRLGATIDEPGEPGHLPLQIGGGGLVGGEVGVAGDVSSQFVSALLLSAPLMRDGLQLSVTSELVARPFVDLTFDVMRAFGAEVDAPDPSTFGVRPGGYRATRYRVEPDATAASYFFAAAAMTGGRVRVEGLGTASGQGDLAFVDVLARMGADVLRERDATEVRGVRPLHGVDVDLSTMPDVAQTFAVVAACAEGPSRVRGVSVIRGHETDRISAVRDELRRCGVGCESHDDGFTVVPGRIVPAAVRTYDDHRMAMSFALLGLVAPGIDILDPSVVSKTFPDYFDRLGSLRSGAR